MQPKIKYFIIADKAQYDNTSNKLSILGLFDYFTVTLFPSESPHFFIVIGFYNVDTPINIRIEIFNPNNQKIIEGVGQVVPGNLNLPESVANFVLEVDKMPLEQRGIYKICILNNDTSDLMAEYTTRADFPIERTITDDERERILKDSTLIKGAQIKIQCPYCNKEYLFAIHLNPNKELPVGYNKFPENNMLECCEGRVLDLTGLKRSIYLSYGQKKPT